MAANVDTPAPELALVALLPLGGVALPAALTRALEAYRHAVTVKPAAEELLSASLAVMAGRATLLADAVTAVRSAADPRGSLIPVLVLLSGEEAGAPWLDAAWRTAADVVLPLEATVAEIASALEKLHRVSAAAAQLPADDIGATAAEKRRIRALRWLATRQVEWLGPTRSPSAPLLHRYGALDAICGAHLAPDLEAMTRAKLLETEHADRVYCCPCGDARLFFRDACEFCHATELAVAHTLRHKACGKVAPSADFWQGEELVCPGCKAPLKQSGVDYDGPFDHTRCAACGKYAARGATLATCLGCGISTDAEKLAVRPLYRYRLTEQGRIAALAVPGAAVAGDGERRAGLLAGWKKL